MTITTSVDPATTTGPDVATARIAGLLYLGVGITGILGFLIIRPQLFDAGDPAATAAQLVAGESIARLGIAVEMLLVTTQSLTALWFYKLFRSVDSFAAVAIAFFGTVNAVAQLGSAALLATALQVAITPVADGASQLLYLLGENFWGIGNLFFGLWLIPMGVAVLRSRWAPRVLAWILIGGGACYLASAFVLYLSPATPAAVATAFIIPATVGEFWMIGWLLSRRPRTRARS